MDILLAIDDDQTRSHAITAVRDWLPADAEVVALHVGDRAPDPTENTGGISGGGLVGMPYLTLPQQASDEEIDLRARQVAAQAAEAVGGDARVESGDPADTILRVAAQMQADLIVIGTGDRSWVARLFDASVGTKVAGKAPCSVLLVREPDTDDGERS